MQPWIAVMLLTMSAGVASAQDPGKQGSKEAKSTPPAGSGATSASAEGGTARKTSAQETTTNEKKKPKKVWTNDEIGSVNGGVSVVGDGKPGDPSRSATEGSGDSRDARAETVRNYRDQIRQLRDQMAAADRRIEQLKSFKGENTSPSGGFNINQGYNMVPVEEQVKQLQEKKKKLEAKIEDVEVEARKNGVDPGELR
jgi:hypothetical protein